MLDESLLLRCFQTDGDVARVTWPSGILPGNFFIHEQSLVQVAVQDVAEHFPVTFRHVAYLLLKVLKRGVNPQLLGQRFQFFVVAERIPVIFFLLNVRHHAIEDFQVDAPIEKLLTHPCEERSG